MRSLRWKPRSVRSDEELDFSAVTDEQLLAEDLNGLAAPNWLTRSLR